MEQYLKRYFWVAILLVIALSTGLVAKTANTFVGSVIEPPPLLGLDATKPIITAANVITADMERVGHLFGIEPPAVPSDMPSADALALAGGEGGADDALAKHEKKKNINYSVAPVKTGEKVQLLATMVANEEQWSSALISDLEKMESRRFVIGESIHGFDIYKIQREPDRVIIENTTTARLEYIDDTAGTGASTVATAGLGKIPAQADVPAPDKVDDGIKKLGDNKYMIPKETLEAKLADMNSLATQARIVPSFKNGQSDGFKLFSIQPGSVYSELGIQNGDVIQSINGIDINSPEKALAAYAQLKDSGNFDIVLDRRGQTVKSNYSIGGGQ